MTLYSWWNYCHEKLKFFHKISQVFARVLNTPIYLFKKNLKKTKAALLFPIQITTPTQTPMITYLFLTNKIRGVFMSLYPWWNYCYKKLDAFHKKIYMFDRVLNTPI